MYRLCHCSLPLLLPSTCVRLGAPKCDISPCCFNNASSRRKAGIFRQCTNSQRSIWTHDFVESLQGDYKRTYVERVEKLNEEVKDMLIDETVGSLTKLELIDDLQRLGIGYHFEKEIKRTLDILPLYKDTFFEDSLHFRALYFRLLRQHGYKASQDVLKDFISKTGRFRQDLCEDVKGMLSLYEASHLCLEGENILHDARDFTVKHLKLLNDNMDPRITDEVICALELPLHWKLPRLEARDYIDVYQRKQKMNPVLLELAQLDFNVLQAIHREELKNMSRWWKHLGLSDKLNFARDRLVEGFLWSVGLAYKPEHQRCREWIAKTVSFIITLDDIYDIHGSLHELELLTTAIERWDLREIEQLPDYMRICYLALFNTTNDIAYTKYKEHGFDILPHLKKVWTEFCKAMLLEAKWSKMQYTPLLTEYLENAWVSSSTTVVLVCAYFATEQPITDDVLEALENNPDIIYCSAMVLRLCNDLASSSAGIDRDCGPSAIQCYMKEANTSEQDARDKVRGLIFKMWKKLNESIYDSPFEQSFVDIAMNHARTAHSIYRLGDGISFQDLEASKSVARLLIKPINIQKS
ncbi:Myrcene synthase protein [Thalictrum thalictroides]|uniref:Myrcene synthase protein n=1 Tax=Thalictrum thalictroides TaxID=46969 RepID=A0A7J6VFZ4_THATH|nr:Myrcene synthase protein [Thalictrum thalictroides]